MEHSTSENRKFVYSVMEPMNNTNVVGIYEQLDDAIQAAKLFVDKALEGVVCVNRIALNEISYCGSDFDVCFEYGQRKHKYI
jgi:hypothetical protein